MDSVNIKLHVGGVEIPSHPVFGDDIKLKFSKENNQVFLRSKIDGNIKFIGSDFDFIASCSHDTEFTIVVYRGSALFGSGTFIKSDCTLNYDDRVCTVKLTVTDRYEKFLANYDNKYNLVKLAPAVRQLGLTLRPILQFYVRGEDKITNIYGGMYFEQDCQVITSDSDLYNTYKFYDTAPLAYISIDTVQNGLPEEAKGKYNMKKSVTSGTILYFNDSETYRIQATVLGTLGFMLIQNINGDNTDPVVAYAELSSWHDAGNYALTFHGVNSEQSLTKATGYYYKDSEVFSRVLIPKKVGGSYADYEFDRPSDDITEKDGNYPYVLRGSSGLFTPHLTFIGDRSATPTEWGTDGNSGTYFLAPTLTSTQKANGDSPIPFGRSSWNRASAWLIIDSELRTHFDPWNKAYTLKDAYPLWSAISVLLKEVDSNVVFAQSAQCSKFLYQATRGEQAIMRTPRLDGRELYLTPITNVKKTQYEQAAQRGDITLKQILDMLRNVYQCYWYIDDSNRLVIEHINYFKHGRRYALGTSYPDIDVSAMKDMPNGLSWAFGTNEAEFDRSKCPSRYEFAWGDECTAEFNGEAIDIEDKYASGDKKEKITVSNFTADIDYTVINPSGVSDDIYALIEANVSNNVPIPNIRITDQSPIYAIQNGYLSYLFTERYYWPYDLGGWRARAGDAVLDVRDTRRFAKQSVLIPIEGSGVSPFNILIAKTGLGVGDVNEMEVSADTMAAKTKIFLENNLDYSRFLEVEKDPYSHGTSVWVLYNNSYSNLVVKWMHPSTGSINTVRMDAHTYVFTIMGQTPPEPIILSVELDTERLTLVREPNLAYGGSMNNDIVPNLEIGADQYTVRFDGNRLASYDWGYAQFRTGSKSALVHITASTEQTHDKGYAALRPLPVSTDISGTTALAYASGTNNAECTIPPHTTFFVGYSKDMSMYNNNDTVEIIITEIS